jgi:predicted permease
VSGVRRMLSSSGVWWLIPWQVALGTVLLASGGLLLKSVHRLELGFAVAAPDRVWFASVEFDEMPAGQSLGTFVERLRAAIESSPGLDAVALSTLRPLASSSRGPVFVQGLTKVPESQPMPWGPPPPPPPRGAKVERPPWIVSNSFISPQFFGAIGLPIVQGRDFTVRDVAGAPRVAIVNQTFASKAFGQANPIGRRIGTDRSGLFDIEVVGVVRDLRTEHLREPAPDAMFFPLAQMPKDQAFTPNSTGALVPRDLTLSMRMAPGARQSAAELRQRIIALDPRPLVDRVWTLDEEVGKALSQERLLASLGSLLGSLSLVLLVIGLYGAMSAALIRARRELGIRLALGASPRSLGALVVGRGLAVVTAGLIIGLPLSYFATRFFAHVLYGVRRDDPIVAAVVAGILLLTAALAAYLPARQAARVDPVVALRAE